jgi:hypothetical protein
VTNWERIESGGINDCEMEALRAVAAQEPVTPCYLRGDVQHWTLRDLALAGLVEMRNGDGEVKSPWDIEFAVGGGWLGVRLHLTGMGRSVVAAGVR